MHGLDWSGSGEEKNVWLLWRRKLTFGLVKNCIFTLIILSVKSYVCQNTWNRALSYRFNAATRNICLRVEKYLSGSRETFVWESRNICLGVEKHLSESRETFFWESRNICLGVEKRLSESRETFVWESRNICLRVEKHLSESRETFVWESRNICLRVDYLNG